MNCLLKIPTGFHLPAQGWSNPGSRVAVKPQPQWGWAIIETPQGHNPGGVDEDQSHDPRVARHEQPWALFHNPVGIELAKIPMGFHPPAQGWNNPGHCVVMHPQPQRGCVIIRSSHGHNPVGVDKNQSRYPRVAHRSQPWALFRNPFGIEQRKFPMGFRLPSQGSRVVAISGKPSNKPTTLTGLHQPA